MDALLAAKLVSAGSSLILAGHCFSSAYSTVPVLRSFPPSTSTPIFAKLIYSNTRILIPSVFASAGTSAYLAYAVPPQRSLWTAAALAVFLILPVTPIFIGKRMQRLVRLGQAGGVELEKAERSGEVGRLYEAWALHNWVRTAMVFVGGMCGLLATIDPSKP